MVRIMNQRMRPGPDWYNRRQALFTGESHAIRPSAARGRVIDPGLEIDGIFDVAIKDGKIAAVTANTVPSSAKQVVDVSGKLVLPGLIDTHGHVFQYVTGRFGLDADLVGVHSGVTT